jgi:hypothetical protein
MGTPEQLYEVSGEVYMRLEGSLHGPLKPSEIQEWTKQVFNKVLKTPRMCGLDSFHSFQNFPLKEFPCLLCRLLFLKLYNYL